MNNPIYTGGPAYPVEDLSKTQCVGLTVRDAFAIAAMQGLIAHGYLDGVVEYGKAEAQLAIDAISMADAMLKAREQGA